MKEAPPGLEATLEPDERVVWTDRAEVVPAVVWGCLGSLVVLLVLGTAGAVVGFLVGSRSAFVTPIIAIIVAEILVTAVAVGVVFSTVYFRPTRYVMTDRRALRFEGDPDTGDVRAVRLADVERADVAEVPLFDAGTVELETAEGDDMTYRFVTNPRRAARIAREADND